MSSKLLNNNSPFLNNTLLDLPLLRETFVAPETSSRADLYAIRKATERSLDLQERDRDDRALQTYTPEIVLPDEFTDHNEKVLSTMQDISYSISDIVASNQSGFSGLQDGLKSVREGITDMTGIVHEDLGVLNQAVSTIYGTNLPTNKSLSELGRDISRDGKSTALAMMLIGGLDKNKTEKIFGNRLIGYIKQGLSEEEAKEINSNCYRSIAEIKEQRRNLYKNKDKVNPAEFTKQSAELFSREMKAKESIIDHDDIRLLGISEKIVGKNMGELVKEGIVNPKILEVMVRNGITNGETSDKLSRIIRQDENGNITPLIELPGITGIFQQEKTQTVLQNIMVKQGALQLDEFRETNRNLGDINHGIQATNRNLRNIDSGIQETNRNLGSINYGIQTANTQLISIGDSLDYGNELQEITNHYLEDILISNERIGDEIAFTREIISGILVNVGNILVNGFNALQGELQQNTQEIRNLSVIQAHSLVELRKQTEVLLDVKNTLKSPGNTRANELVLDGIKALEYNFIDDAKECFFEAVKQSRVHLYANFGLGIVLNTDGKNNEALNYFFRAEDIATREGNDIIASLSMLEQAKIFVKSMNLDKALFLLEKAEPMNPDNIEISLLKAKILILKKDTGFLEIELERIFNMIFLEKSQINGNLKGYEKVFKLIKPKIVNHIKGLIKDKNYNNLFNIINALEICGIQEALVLAINYTIKISPESIIKYGIDIKSLIEQNSKDFEHTYKEIITNNQSILSRNNGLVAYNLALWGYKTLPFELIEKIILIGIKSDPNYLYLKRKVDEDKSKFRHDFLKNIYSIGFEAKAMFDEFLRRNPKFK